MKYETVGKACNEITFILNTSKRENVVFDQPKKNPTITDLRFRYMQMDYDGVTEKEAEVLRCIFGPKEEVWRNQREFFNFCVGNHASRSDLVFLANAAAEAARCAGETEDYVRWWLYEYSAKMIKYTT